MTFISHPDDGFCKNQILVGEVVAAQGVKGEVRIKTYTQDPLSLTRYGTLKSASGEDVHLTIVQVRGSNFVIGRVKDCLNRNQAEQLVGLRFYVDRSQLPLIQDDEFYYNDLIGMKVFNERQESLGTVMNVENFGAGDFLEIHDIFQKVFTISFNKQTILSLDKESKVMKIDSRFLLS